eukprot:scaffold15179_cov22-Tisochrysis_lutea.AAC.1
MALISKATCVALPHAARSLHIVKALSWRSTTMLWRCPAGMAPSRQGPWPLTRPTATSCE